MARMAPPQPHTVTIEFPVEPPQPVQQPTYSAGMGWGEQLRHLEVEVRRLATEVRELSEKVTALQQQQQQTPVRRDRRRWYQKLTVVETTWSDDRT